MNAIKQVPPALRFGGDFPWKIISFIPIPPHPQNNSKFVNLGVIFLSIYKDG